jgi:circadian clock protein KaiC
MPSPSHIAPHYDPERVATGIEGLDNILGGGFPRNHMYLVEGDAGAGKTTLGLQFLLEGSRRGERVLWITMSETERELKETARSHGWSMEGISICNLAISEESLKADAQYTFFSPADVELNDTTKAVLEAVERLQPSRVVFDPFSDIRLLARDPLRYRRQVLALREFFTSTNCTVLLMQESARGMPGDAQAEALVHGYLTLHQDSPEYGGQRRRLRVHKMRGIPFRDGYHDFSIVTGGLRIYPRLVAAEHYERQPEELVSSLVPHLDQLLGGGIERGSSLLFMGPAGVGKSTLATQYALAFADRGEKGAIFLFDETLRAFATRSEGLGLGVRRHLNSKQLVVRHIDSAEFSPGEFTYTVRQAVEEDGAAFVMIDSLSGYLSAMPEDRFLTTHLHEMLTYLSYKNVLTVLTLGQHGILGESLQSPIDISHLSDSVLLLRYFESFGAVRRALSVVKKRSGPHEKFIRELKIGPVGIHVGEPLRRFQGVMTGRPTFEGEESQLTKGPDPTEGEPHP